MGCFGISETHYKTTSEGLYSSCLSRFRSPFRAVLLAMPKRRRERVSRQSRRRIASKRDCRGSPNNPEKAGFLSSFILRGQERLRPQEASPGLSSAKSASALSAFQDGIHPNGTGRGSSPRFSDSLGSFRCIFPHPNRDTLETTSQGQHSLEESCFPVQSTSLRAFVSTAPIHQGTEGTCTLSQVQRPSDGGISRRSAVCQRVVREGAEAGSGGQLPISFTGLYHQSEEIDSQANPEAGLSGLHSGYLQDGFSHATSETQGPSSRGKTIDSSDDSDPETGGQVRGQVDRCITSHHTSPAASSLPPELDNPVDRQSSTLVGSSTFAFEGPTAGSALVVPGRQPMEWMLDVAPPSRSPSHYRRFEKSLRWLPLAGRQDLGTCIWPVPTTFDPSLYQPERIVGNFLLGAQTFGGQDGCGGGDPFGQHLSSCMFEELRQQGACTQQDSSKSLDLVSEETNFSDSILYPRSSQHPSRCSVQDQLFFLAAQPQGISTDLSRDTNTDSGSLCEQGRPFAASVLQQISVPASGGSGRPSGTLARRRGSMGTPPSHSHPEGVTEVASFSCDTVASNSSLDGSTLVSTTAGDVLEGPLILRQAPDLFRDPASLLHPWLMYPWKCAVWIISNDVSHGTQQRISSNQSPQAFNGAAPNTMRFGKGGSISAEFATYKRSRSTQGRCRFSPYSCARGQWR